ncbi:MFS transporter [Niveispirillum sp. BGYR6]|uniref:spinster family MFS transporter n=1 Tax=Niveispirillum sp. BGYR6 TaxID=2971249 RepID=UPI0022B9913A|nr:MFS transporter [Niveispirillum sp. BGYR6]MDG5496540.1 MFS transporter [Niveispirillum sp. BGYR6]
MQAAVSQGQRPYYRYYVLLILILVYIFNFIDRQILGILASPIKKELGLSDQQLGLMGGMAFALFYTALGIPIALVADRKSRTWIMTGALTIWSGFTALCGFATGFWQLFLCRLGVGVGEAGGVAPAYSLISDYFPPQERARALAAYSFGIPIGMAAGVLFGGVIAHQIGWRWAFIICGLAGLLLAPLFKLTVREPVRGGFDAKPTQPIRADHSSEREPARTRTGRWFGISLASAAGALLGGLIAYLTDWPWAIIISGLAGLLLALLFRLVTRAPERGGVEGGGAVNVTTPGLGDALTLLFQKPSFWLLALGASCSSILGYGLAFWLPSFFERSHGLALVDRSIFYAGILFFGGMVGVWLGGSLGDRFGANDKGNYARVPAVAFLVSLPFFIGGIMSPSLPLVFFLFVVPQALSLMWLGPTLSAVQHLVPATMRTTASAIFLFVNNLIGIGFGTWFLGVLSDYLVPRYGANSLRYSILYGMVFYLLASGLFFLAARRLNQDWHRE